MKRRFLVWGLILGLLVSLISACGTKPQPNTGGEQKEVITLKVADSFPETNPTTVNGTKVWMKRVEELTSGKVKFEFFPAEQLGKAKDMMTLVQNGTADIAMVASSYVGKMPLSEVMFLPGSAPNTEIGCLTYWNLCQGALLDTDFLKNGIRPVMAVTYPPYVVFTTKKEIKVPDDLKGVKMRSAGGLWNEVIESTGAVPIVKGGAEWYEVTQRGVVDGSFSPINAISAYKMEELYKYVIRDVPLGTWDCTLSISDKRWQSLPQDVQKAMLQAGEEVAKSYGKINDVQNDGFYKNFEVNNGWKVYVPTPEEKEKWKQATLKVEQKWVQDMTAKGFPAQKALDERNKLTAQLTGGK